MNINAEEPKPAKLFGSTIYSPCFVLAGEMWMENNFFLNGMRSKMGERLLSSLAGLRFCFLNLFSGHSGDLPHNKITQGSSAEGSEVCIVLPRIFGAKCIRLGPVWKLHVSMLLLLLFFFPFASICLL